ncbi:unknown protein [Seminavis robusta]|uniref:Uncharacterized protein n=1 Tax=Seminavis robusta TaxID=568900 RepID=A0A9N8ELR8_9STRA|nr:unknown protein [Seminavis robusta]|eukprot:Sro1212_g252870.1 n/a (473) ;mRNA; r:6641-8059
MTVITTPPKPIQSPADITEEDLANILPPNPSVGLAERYFNVNGCRLPELMAMAMGLTSVDGRELGNTDIEPFVSMKFHKKVVPTAKDLMEEIKRRCKLDSSKKAPSCRHWNKDKLVSWLKENPMSDVIDRVFVQLEEEKLFNMLTKAAEEKTETAKKNQTGAWVTLEPYLRLIECFFHDDNRELLMRTNKALTRDELDARNSDQRPVDYWEAVARIFNDDSYVFFSRMLPELHPTFADVIDLSFDKVPGTISAQEARRRFSDCRAKLVKIVSKWELSGNGFGQRTTEEPQFGHMEEEQLEEGDNRSSFLDSGTREHILYLWHVADTEEVMKTILSVISVNCAADSESCQSTMGDDNASVNRRKREAEVRAVAEFRSSISDALSNMSHAALLTELREAENRCVMYEERALTTELPRVKKLYDETVRKLEKRITKIQEMVDAIMEQNAKRQRTEEVQDTEEEDSIAQESGSTGY